MSASELADAQLLDALDNALGRVTKTIVDWLQDDVDAGFAIDLSISQVPVDSDDYLDVVAIRREIVRRGLTAEVEKRNRLNGRELALLQLMLFQAARPLPW